MLTLFPLLQVQCEGAYLSMCIPLIESYSYALCMHEILKVDQTQMQYVTDRVHLIPVSSRLKRRRARAQRWTAAS